MCFSANAGRCQGAWDALKKQWQAAASSSVGSSVGVPAIQAPQATSAPGPADVAKAAEPPPAPALAPAVAAAAPVSPVVPSALEALLSGKRRVEVAALTQISRKVALVIGVDDYSDPAIPKLANAVKDADAVGRLLESQLGYETVILRNPTKRAFIAALNKAALSIAPSDSMVVYYAGHGWVVEKTNMGYWQLADSVASNPESWLSNTDIGMLVGQLGASQVALISDSCYSGSLVSNERIRASIGTVDPSRLLATRSVVVMSSGGNEPAADAGKNGNSPFAWNLMKALGGMSEWQPGGNVFERVRFGVARELPQRPKYRAYLAAGHSSGGDYLFERRQLAPVTQ